MRLRSTNDTQFNALANPGQVHKQLQAHVHVLYMHVVHAYDRVQVWISLKAWKSSQSPQIEYTAHTCRKLGFHLSSLNSGSMCMCVYIMCQDIHVTVCVWWYVCTSVYSVFCACPRVLRVWLATLTSFQGKDWIAGIEGYFQHYARWQLKSI